MQWLNQGTKVDSLALELPFQEGLINESHPLWLDGFSVRADSNNKECGSKGRNNYSPKDGFCKIHYVSRGFGAGSKKIRLEIRAKLLGELYLQGITKATISTLVNEINAVAGGGLFSFTVDHLLNSTYTDTDITRDRFLPPSITMKGAFDLMTSMLKQSPAKPPKNTNKIRIIKSHIDRSHVQDHYELPFLLIYDKSLEMQRKGLSSAAALTPLPLIRMETNIRNWKHTYQVTGMDIKHFGDFLEVLEDEDMMSQFFNKATSSWFIRRQIKMQEAPQNHYAIRMLYQLAKADARKKRKQVFDIIPSVIRAQCFDVSERQRRDIKNKVNAYAEYIQQPKPNLDAKYNELETLGFLPQPLSV